MTFEIVIPIGGERLVVDGDQIAKGQIVAVLRDDEGFISEEVLSPADGTFRGTGSGPYLVVEG